MQLPTLLLAALLISACGGYATPASESPSSSRPAALSEEGLPRVAFLGDSLSAGLHLPGSDAFPSVLERLLAEAGQPIELVNAGVSGDTSAGGLGRVDWLLSQGPTVLVVELGGNDGLRGIPLASIEKNLRGIVERAQARDVRVLLLGMHLPANYGEYADGFHALYARVAEDTGAALCADFLVGVGGVAELNLPDGIHPTAEGHRRLAATVRPHLERLLGSE